MLPHVGRLPHWGVGTSSVSWAIFSLQGFEYRKDCVKHFGANTSPHQCWCKSMIKEIPTFLTCDHGLASKLLITAVDLDPMADASTSSPTTGVTTPVVADEGLAKFVGKWFLHAWTTPLQCWQVASLAEEQVRQRDGWPGLHVSFGDEQSHHDHHGRLVVSYAEHTQNTVDHSDESTGGVTTIL